MVSLSEVGTKHSYRWVRVCAVWETFASCGNKFINLIDKRWHLDGIHKHISDGV